MILVLMLVVLGALGAMVFGGVMLALSIVFRVALGLLLLPFRLIGAILFLPFMLIGGLVRGVVGLALLPLTLIGMPLLLGASVVVIVVFSLLTPLLPIVAIGAVIWLLLKASTRPTVI